MRIWGIGIGDWAVVGAVAEEAGFFFRERGVVAEDSGVVAATCWFAGEGRDKRTYIPKIRKRETVSKIFFILDPTFKVSSTAILAHGSERHERRRRCISASRSTEEERSSDSGPWVVSRRVFALFPPRCVQAASLGFHQAQLPCFALRDREKS